MRLTNPEAAIHVCPLHVSIASAAVAKLSRKIVSGHRAHVTLSSGYLSCPT
ncbi:MAG: hypothetical protein OXD36_10885 [Rhodobacter sp.]|nr:hypothetical protein [Rhodobacter sp.]MCY4242234.1 hypothetical protein [Rhodobacter sp.]